jgi:hypothetical protein
MAPSAELFPSESWERPWTAGENGDELLVPYEAGAAHVTAEGRGEIALELDGTPIDSVPIDGAALYELTAHPRHEQHQLSLRPTRGLRIWSVSFAAGVP